MDVRIVSRTKEEMKRCDYRDALEIYIDGVCVFKVCDDEPEDSNLGRSFSDCYDIGKLLEKAYNAGKMGKKFSLEYEESDDI